MSGNEWGSGITVEGFTPLEGDRGPSRDAVGPDYFRTLGATLLRGREFTSRDDDKAPRVAIVNESFARFYFGDADPIGKRIGPGGRDAKPVETQVAERSRRERMLAALSTCFAVLAAFLAAIGVYGVTAYSVRRRRREIGIRIALGAEPVQVFTAVMRDAARHVGLGFAVALPAIGYASRLVSELLYGVKPLDLWSIATACLAMAMTAAMAGAIPARAASRVEPGAALRAE